MSVALSPGTTVEADVGGWGVQFVEVEAADSGSHGLTCNYLGSSLDRWVITRHRVVGEQLGPGTEIVCAGDTVTVLPDVVDGDVLVAIRTGTSDGNLRFKLT